MELVINASIQHTSLMIPTKARTRGTLAMTMTIRMMGATALMKMRLRMVTIQMNSRTLRKTTQRRKINLAMRMTQVTTIYDPLIMFCTYHTLCII